MVAVLTARRGGLHQGDIMRACVAVLGAALVLALGAGAASAITAEPAGEISAISLGKLSITYGALLIECELSLSGSVSSPIANTAGATFATYTGGSMTPCSGSSTWSLLFEGGGWTKALAEPLDLRAGIARFTVRNVQIQWELLPMYVRCLYAGTVSMQLTVSGAPLTTGLLTITGTSMTRRSGSVFCPATLPLAGTLQLAPTQTLAL